MENKKISVRTINLAGYEAPTFAEDKRKEYVPYGANNLFPKLLLELSNKTALHTAILDKKIKLDTGDGIIPIDGDEKTQEFLDNINPNENINELGHKIATDLETFGGYYLQIIRAKDKKSIAQVYHIPYDRIRSGKINDKNQVDTYYYSEKWEKYTKKGDITEMPAFSETKDKNKVQILYVSKYNASSIYYPTPSYVGALQDIDTLAQISNFHNSAIRNNFAPGALIVFKTIPTGEEQDVIVAQIEEMYKGSSNAGEPAIFFVEDDGAAPTITQIEVSDLDKQFAQLSETADKNVTLAHSMPRIVAGLETPGSLGGGKEYIDASIIFFNQYTSKQQKFLLGTLNMIMDINGLEELKIINTPPSIMLLGEKMLQAVLNKNELRDLFGYEPEDITEIKPTEDE